MTEYLAVLIYLILATVLGMIILTVATKISPRRLDLQKRTAYECGFDPFGEARTPFDVGFYLVAILFLVFDIEVAYLLPWALGGSDTGMAGFTALMIFLIVLTIGFVYEWQKGALDWNSQDKNKKKFRKMFLQFIRKNHSGTAQPSLVQMKSTSTVRHHPYHLVDPSPWPFLTSLSALWLAIGLVLYFHQYRMAGTVLSGALLTLVYTVGLWWRDVMRESRLDCHTVKVKKGLHLGMLLFIVTEAMFFVGMLWAFLNAALMPTVQIGMAWPPVGIVPVKADNWHARPILNTWLLLASYFTANNRKHALDMGDRQRCAAFLVLTIVLGAIFSFYQYLEYTDAAFTFSDSVFGSTFYLATGFHGFHVMVGFLYLTVCLLSLKDRGPSKSTALDLAVLYWHFVDIVWVFLLILVYVWGGALPSSGLELCQDGPCLLEGLLYEARLDAFEHSPETFESVMNVSLSIVSKIFNIYFFRVATKRPKANELFLNRLKIS